MLSTLSRTTLAHLSRLIHIYQHTLSPDHGPLKYLFPGGMCRYTPTCSQYTDEAFRLYGWNGLFISLRRLLRCHPYSSGGNDPVPKPVRRQLPPTL